MRQRELARPHAMGIVQDEIEIDHAGRVASSAHAPLAFLDRQQRMKKLEWRGGRAPRARPPAAPIASPSPPVNSLALKRIVSFAAMTSQNPAGTASSIPLSPRITNWLSSDAMKRSTPLR